MKDGLVDKTRSGIKLKLMKNKTTIDKLARMVQRGFEENKKDSQKTNERIDRLAEHTSGEILLLRRDMDAGFQAVAQVLKQMREDIKSLDYGPEVIELRARLERLERKVGISRV